MVPNPNEPAWRKNFRTSFPLDISYIPIGIACGILLHAAGFNTFNTILVSLLVFSGGAQFLIASMLTINSPLLTIVLMLFFLELRYALLGSSLSKYLRGQNTWFLLLFAGSMNDENYAVNYLKFSTDKHFTQRDALQIEHWSLLFWTVSNLIGSLVGTAITIDLTVVHFALTALFLFMIVMQIKSFLKIIIAGLAAVLAIFFLVTTKSTLGLVFATLVASFVGFLADNYLTKQQKKSRLVKMFKNPAGTPKE
ncbi:AzlC family ABC transporter permease [Fructilactobacillus myrtifloralis]|uniref:AzlC family ABC transporter permease n=1 Tax=Fructilactobacillus myrtifloralis TaxID=2940301 RepID=A0ABY5BT91_9LACO|nr:AzlC family ABC transporter permease [Fructilactobacillus myrtifloralis]USS85811.1 AzlC family ABC transporter permease [Fructilactobacillus myrtifloralis]